MAALVVPDVTLKDSFLAAMAEFAAEGRTGDGSGIGRDLEDWTGRWETDAGFAAYVAQRVGERDHVDDPDWVLCTNLWWVDDQGYVGRMSIRHELNEWLREVGGHIGYDVRASRRREGHATAMLAAALPIARDLGIDRALLTCDDDNVASRLVIERNGGVFEDARGGKLRFWVPTDHSAAPGGTS
ncbi:GNAT family N-acetyltransferase [Nocardioides pocheonensis]|nr:GNAT family N-acetyltransferase [Nocardioides pocheonensis]